MEEEREEGASIDCDIVNLNAKEAVSHVPLLSRKFCAPRSIFFSYGAIFEVIMTRVRYFTLMVGESYSIS